MIYNWCSTFKEPSRTHCHQTTCGFPLFCEQKDYRRNNECRKDSHIFLPSRLMGRLKQSTWRNQVDWTVANKNHPPGFSRQQILNQQKTGVEFPSIMGSMYEKGPLHQQICEHIPRSDDFGDSVLVFGFVDLFSFRFVYDYLSLKVGKVSKKVCQWLNPFDSSIEKIPRDRSE